MGSEAKNLEAISKAIDQHNATCPWPASEVRMNPYEIERLGWEEIRGLPLVGDPEIGTGRFRIVCSREGDGAELEEVEAIGARSRPRPRSASAPTTRRSDPRSEQTRHERRCDTAHARTRKQHQESAA
ncbi:MAG TPA: hypothetical protein VD765_05900 [Solirubrobacterales bacterium]|nr:hypothetical protein [Solirubrobacterales bacterium]